MTELLPCPFCGGKPYKDEATIHKLGTRTGHRWAVGCSWCEVSAHGAMELAEAIAAWNRRAPVWQPIATAPKEPTNE